MRGQVREVTTVYRLANNCHGIDAFVSLSS
jgi:hypothetical protein